MEPQAAQMPIFWPTPSNFIMRTLGTPLHKAVAYRVLPALTIKNERMAEVDDLRNEIFASNPHMQRIQFVTGDHLSIDGVVIWVNQDDKETQNFSKRPWILYFNGNSECYEENLKFLKRYSAESECNLLGFNYRGVCHSQGEPYEAKDLTLDGDAAFQFLQRHQVADDRILIHARSLGGAVGTHVRSLHPDGPICNERSFSTWADLEAFHQSKSKQVYLQTLLQVTHWDFSPLQNWDDIRGRKWIIVSPSDEVIDHDTASFCQGVLRRHPEQDNAVIRLPELHSLMHNGAPEGHNVPLVCKEYSTSWQKHIEFVRACFIDN